MRFLMEKFGCETREKSFFVKSFSTICFLFLCVTSSRCSSDHDDNDVTKDFRERSTNLDIHGTKVTRQIEEMFRVHSYELSIRPNNDGLPVDVYVSLLIESITDISEKNMDLTFTLCIHETWTDERLRFYDETVESIVLPSRLVQKIWIPDLYLVGSKHSFIHKTTVDNTVLRLFKTGKIFYNVKLTTTVACQMNLYNFPLDTENCSLILQSLGYNYNELRLHWKISNQSLFMSDKLVKNMPKFRLMTYQYQAYNVRTDEMQNFADVMVSRLQINFIFKRYLLSVFFQSYFLAMSMVVLAGMGMWVDPQSVPARVAISVTSVLTLSTIITGLKTSLPKVSYLTAMDVYLWICFLFIFSTVLEFCIFNYIMTQRRNHDARSAVKEHEEITTSVTKQTDLNTDRFKSRSHVTSSDFEVIMNRINNDMTSYTKERRKETAGGRNKPLFYLEKPEVIEIYFRLAYFAAFLFFNGIYWNYYMRHAYDGESYE